jgi:hypothetical protein
MIGCCGSRRVYKQLYFTKVAEIETFKMELYG